MSPWQPEYYAMPAESLQQDNTEARLWGELFALGFACFGCGALLVSLIWRHPGLSEGVLKWQRS